MDSAVKAQLQAANAIYREGKFAEAEIAYVKVLEVDHRNMTAMARLGEIALWSNRAEKAEHCFMQVMQNVAGLQKRWPFNAQIKALLAMTYYRQDRFPQAAQFFKEAAGKVAFGPFRNLKAIGDQLALFDEHTPYLVEGPEVTQVQFIATDPLPVVEVSINGSKLLPFFIDTGGAEVALDTKLANEIGAELAGTITGESAGPKGSVGVGKLDSMTIGDFVVKNVPIHTVDTASYSAIFEGLNVKGVVGTRMLMHFLGTIDYVNGDLILRRNTQTNLQKLEAQLEASRVKAIPFWLIQTHLLVAWGMVNSKGPMLFLVDTGLAGKGFTAPESTLRDAGIAVDWAKAKEGIGGFGKAKEVDIVLDQLTLGTGPNEVVEHHVPGSAIKKFGLWGYRFGFWIGGLISHQFFRHYALTLDFVGMRLIVREENAHDR
jgi:hypothetical protein